MKIHYSPSPEETNVLGTDELRARFLIGGLFQAGELNAHYTDPGPHGRRRRGPRRGPDCPPPPTRRRARASSSSGREIGILNLGEPGIVRVGGVAYELGTRDCLYVGLGERDVSFEGGRAGQAAFYFVSTPAHMKHPTAVVRAADLKTDPIGDPAKANRRRINRASTNDGIKSCQLVMGFTEFEPGSGLEHDAPARPQPPHGGLPLLRPGRQHRGPPPGRAPEDPPPDRPRPRGRAVALLVRHAGAGTGNYRFVWAMGGDNQVFSDMGPGAPGDPPMSDFLTAKFGLAGKVALVTGSSQGLGLAMARALAQAGARVIINGRDAAKLAPVVGQLTQAGAQATAIAADLGNRPDVERLVAEAIAWSGRLDILVNNAGIIRRPRPPTTPTPTGTRSWASTWMGVFTACRAAGRHMLVRGSGKIINIASLLTFFAGSRSPGTRPARAPSGS